MEPGDIGRLVEVSDPRVSPDGTRIAYVVTTVDLPENTYRSSVWVVGADGGQPPARLTSGEHRDAKPRWSPDGGRLSFVSHRSKPGAELYVLDLVAGGEARCVVAPDEEIEDVAWSPDGATIAFTSRDRDDEVYGPEADKDRPPRRIDRLSYRLDSVGWTIDRPRHVWVVPAGGGEARMVTDGPFQDAGVAWSPDGSTLALSSARTETWDVDLISDIYQVPVEGGDPVALTDGTASLTSPSWSPDGRHVAYVWSERTSFARFGQIGVVDTETGEQRLLTTALDRHCAPYLALARDPVWDGAERLLFQVDESGNVPLYAVDLDGNASVIVSGERQVTGFDIAGGTLAAVLATATTLPELYVIDGDGDAQRLTHHSDDFHSAVTAAAPERFTATSSDGTEVEAWLLLPQDATGGDASVPVVLDIHGGPFSQYGNRFFDEFQLLVGAGYAVLYANPRGSSGYGESFARAIRGPRAEVDPGTGWGGADHEDLMAVVDAALERFPELDGDRMAVMGGSYGGYMTSWIIGHSDRFKTAISERALNNMLTFAHTSDIGTLFPAGYIGATHLEDPEEFIRQSPTTYWRDIDTPVLILHSENDLRCPIEQAEDLYVRLKMSGKQVEFVRFPGESHELSRSGNPAHRVTRAGIVLDWFSRTL